MPEDHHGSERLNFDRVFAIGIVLNLAFVLVEAGYGWHIQSLALLADAGHNLSDVAGLLLAWLGAWAGRWPPNTRHTYGWKRGSILAAFANAVLLLLAMSALVWEAINRLAAPSTDTTSHGLTMMAVAGLGIVVNAATAWLFMRGSKTDLNIRGAFMHMAADALVSAGVVVAGALTLWMGWWWLDAAMSLLIAGVILVGTWSLFKASLHLMFDGVPAAVDPVAVQACLLSLPGVSRVERLHIWAISTHETVLSAHLRYSAGTPDEAFYSMAAERLHHECGIAQSTLQMVPVSGPCEIASLR